MSPKHARNGQLDSNEESLTAFMNNVRTPQVRSSRLHVCEPNNGHIESLSPVSRTNLAL